MAIDYALVKTSLFQWATLVIPSGMPVIYWEPNYPRPFIPYITLYLSTINSVNQDWESSSSNVGGIVDMKGDRQFTLQIQAYGGDPLTLLENMRTSLQKQTILDTLRVNGIAFYQSFAINDITELVDSRYERRAQFDVLFGIGQITTDNPGYFDHLIANGKIYDENNQLVYNKNLTIP